MGFTPKRLKIPPPQPAKPSEIRDTKKNLKLKSDFVLCLLLYKQFLNQPFSPFLSFFDPRDNNLKFVRVLMNTNSLCIQTHEKTVFYEVYYLFNWCLRFQQTQSIFKTFHFTWFILLFETPLKFKVYRLLNSNSPQPTSSSPKGQSNLPSQRSVSGWKQWRVAGEHRILPFSQKPVNIKVV